jgi:hypothetical protein
MNQERLSEIKRQKQSELYRIQPHTLNAVIDNDNFTFTAVPGGVSKTVPKKITIKSEIRVGTAQPQAVDFFRNIGCIVNGDSIDMMKLNQIKQYLDMIKDGTSSNLLKKLKVFSFTEDPRVIPNVTYPNTLDAIKEYFNEHYKKEGKLSSVFWPRHGEYSFYLRDSEIAFHDCGFKPSVCIVKGPSDYIDPLAHGPFQPATDLVFPRGGTTIVWTSDMLQTIGYPAGCSITATNIAQLGQAPKWNIDIVCQNSDSRLKVRIDNSGIYTAATLGGALTKGITGIKGVTNLEQMTKGNAFKSYIQKEASGAATIKDDMKLILLGLILIKSFGDNSFDITQRELLLYGFPTTIFTCDFTLFLSAITSGMESSAVLTTNTRPTPGGPTGNLSTRFSPIDLTPKQELDAIFESCMFENYQYLRMVVNLYNAERQRQNVPGILIKAGSENKTVNLWFLVTIIRAIKNNMLRHIQIYAEFVKLLPPGDVPPPQDWKDNKEKILQLLKCYCKIVFPFINKNGIWSVFAQTGLTSKDPQVTSPYVSGFATPCQTHIQANKDSLKVAIDECLNILQHETGTVVSIGKINAQQYASLIDKHFRDTAKIDAKTRMNAKLPDIPVDSCDMFNLTTDNTIIRIPEEAAARVGTMLAPVAAPVVGVAETEAAAAPVVSADDADAMGAAPAVPVVADDDADDMNGPGLSSTIPRGGAGSPKRIRRDITIPSKELARYIQGIHKKDEITYERLVSAGFPPKTLSGHHLSSTLDEHIEEQRLNFKIIVVIMLHNYLSNVMIWINKKITSDIAAAYDAQPGAASAAMRVDTTEIEIQKLRCKEIFDALSKLIRQAQDISSLFNVEEMAFLRNIVEGFKHFDPSPSVELMEEIEGMISIISQVLNSTNINPSMDTIEFAVSRLNFDIYYRCVKNRGAFIHFYVDLQRARKVDLDYITKLHTGKVASVDLSFYIYFYENIHNIAYNVFYNHEYFLPFDCEREFEEMLLVLQNETTIDIRIDIREPTTAAVVNPFDLLTQDDSSQGSLYNSSISPSPIRHRMPRGIAVDGPGYRYDSVKEGPLSRGRSRSPGPGGSSHTLRKKQKKTKRTRRRRRSHHRKRTCKKSNK